MNDRRRSPLAVRDFRLLWFGESVSVLGDQFALIALPWLALLLTGSPLALGTVLAAMAVPRALLMIVGGAYVDRLSPRRVMIWSNAVRMVAVAALGSVVLVGLAELWMLYVFALVFGLADAFYYPAHSAIVPDLVSSDQLQQANGIIQGTAQLSVLVGPALAGIAIAGLSISAAGPGVAGVGLALLIDAITFGVSLVAVLFIKRRQVHAGHVEGSVASQIAEGIRFVWQNKALRVVMVLSVFLNLLITGPFEVGLPVLAFTRLPEGAAAFGLMTAAFGGGSAMGLLAATLLRPLPPTRFGTVMLCLLAAAGLAIVAVAFVTSTLAAMAVAAVIGLVLGYTNVSFLTWIQRRLPRALMGRVMALLMFSSIALVPISMAVAGAVVEVTLEGLFIVAGLGMAGVSLIGVLSRDVRRMGLAPVIETTDSAPDANATTEQAAAA